MKTVEEYLEGIRDEKEEVGAAIKNLLYFCDVLLNDVCRWRGRRLTRKHAGDGGCSYACSVAFDIISFMVSTTFIL